MSCLYPLLRYKKALGDGSTETIKVPCGRCRGCRIDRARDWALRCVHESMMHEDNCFLTLTYNDESLPKDGSVSKKEMQLFIKRLRKFIEPRVIKFYGCGEYGEKFERPHYHVLVFGYDFEDKVFHHVSNPKERTTFSNEDQHRVYISEDLHKLWPKGFVTIGEVTMASAGYVARYIGKKITGDIAFEHYRGKTPEFALMSRRPGIGASFIENYFYDMFPKDFTTVDGRKYKSTRFYDNRLKRRDWAMYEDIKQRREDMITDDDLLRRTQKDRFLKEIQKPLKRGYES